MSDKPDSLLTAAKKVAEHSGLPWSHVQKAYADLQVEPTYMSGEQVGPSNWLPKSVGRNIWAAHPHFVSRLLVALAAASDPSQSREAVQWTRDLTPDGRPLGITEGDHAGVVNPFEAALTRYLIDPAKAETLAYVEFVSDWRRVLIRDCNDREEVWASAEPAYPENNPLIRFRGVIAGNLFLKLSQTVRWRRADQSPVTTGDDE